MRAKSECPIHVVLKLAEFFDIEEVPWKPDRTTAEWAAVRAGVRAALARYRADRR